MVLWGGGGCRGGVRGVLTDIRSSLGDGQVGAHTPSSALVVLLTPATVRARGVVLTLTRQPFFVKDATVGMEIALAPVNDETAKKKE